MAESVESVEPELLAAAIAVQARAHVPYSHFHVGAAIRTRSGRVFTSCNVENAAYPQSVCAEAGAISAMVSGGEYLIDAVLTVCDGDALSTCCGGCRQKIREFADERTPDPCRGPGGCAQDVHDGGTAPGFVRPREPARLISRRTGPMRCS